MGVYRFEDLRMWQAARAQCDQVAEWTKRPAFRRDTEISKQLNAATLSVVLNIAEGFARRRDGETRQFLRYALASNAEVRACFYVAQGRHYLSDVEAERAIDSCNAIGRMVSCFMATLK
jgi:four helix bundle protein